MVRGDGRACFFFISCLDQRQSWWAKCHLCFAICCYSSVLFATGAYCIGLKKFSLKHRLFFLLEKYRLIQEGIQTAPCEPLHEEEFTVLGDIIKYVKRKRLLGWAGSCPASKFGLWYLWPYRSGSWTMAGFSVLAMSFRRDGWVTLEIGDALWWITLNSPR